MPPSPRRSRRPRLRPASWSRANATDASCASCPRWSTASTTARQRSTIRCPSQIFERYLEALDGNRSYLLASDIAEFEPLRYQLDDAIQKADAGPAFRIFTRFQERNREVLRYAIALLDVEPDFTLDESFRFDRTDDGWPASADELHELWRKRVKNDALSLLLAGKTWPEASDVLRKRYERVAKRIEQVTADDVFETFMNAYSHVYDPHSNYLSPRNSEEYNIAMSLSYEGIGASLQLVDDYVTIMNVLPGGSAAASSDVKVGDRITAVGQGECRRADRRGRLAPRRRRAADPRAGKHARAAADPAGLRLARHAGSADHAEAIKDHAGVAGGEEGNPQAASAATRSSRSASSTCRASTRISRRG